MRIRIVVLVALYLAAIVAANLISAHYGPKASIANAFFLIGLDITTRDALHEFWTERRWPKMLGLIAAGSLLAFAINPAAERVAIASAVAFLASELADAGVYQALHRQPWYARVGSSNAVSAAIDSLLFPTIAFGGFVWATSSGQFIAKVAGGALWMIVLGRLRKGTGSLDGVRRWHPGTITTADGRVRAVRVEE